VRLARAGDGLGSGGRCMMGSVKLGRQRGGRHGASGAGAGPTMGQTALGQAGDGEAGAGRAVPGPSRERGGQRRVEPTTGRLARSGRHQGPAGGVGLGW
jgi:hypothetical protein